ncbi:MAG: 1-(5-phosphoribosyl)-5-[(5-phosphoribosylamino)methylideneamino]imidazole-4-carboxamide isomerase [Dehalococcoidia bacterium]
MEVIPGIDLRLGRCVRLVQGDFARETVFADDPVAVARHWEELGAPRLHVVDLEGARTGAPVELDTIEAILHAVSIPVQVAGGIRTLQQANQYLRAGADRVVFGTAAVRDQGLIVEALAMDPRAVVVALDGRNGRIHVQGWLDSGGVGIIELARTVEALGVPRVLSTDIARDGTLSEPNYAGLAALQAAVSCAVIASGGVASIAHLKHLAALGVEGVIIGRALYSGEIQLVDALQAGRESR